MRYNLPACSRKAAATIPHHLCRSSITTAAASTPKQHAGPISYCDHACSLEGWRRPLSNRQLSSSSPTPSSEAETPIVALGKFDALHRGHQALAMAAADLGGAPWLVSFSGIAEVLGWPSRLPLVAPCDRRRVLETWKDACGGMIPAECSIPFADVRSMSPAAFVELLAQELSVGGVVVGSNFRFGYKAAGTAAMMQELAPQHGMKVHIVDLVARRDGVPQGQPEIVSSSRVRDALTAGDMDAASLCLGRPYRLVADIIGDETLEIERLQGHFVVHSASYNNQPPAPGRYKVQVGVVGSGWDAMLVGSGKESEVVIDEEGLAFLEGTPLEIPRGSDRKLLLDFV